MSVEDTQAKAVLFFRHSIQHDWTDTISGVYVSPSSRDFS